MISNLPMEKMINYVNRPKSLNFSDNTRTGPKCASSLPRTLALRLRLCIKAGLRNMAWAVYFQETSEGTRAGK